jgi:hypothetical protein
MSTSEFYKRFRAALVLAMMAMSMAVLPACSSSEEESSSTQDEICDEADAGAENCDDLIS